MKRYIFDGRRFLVQALLAVNLVIWGACFAWADDKQAEYASATFQAGGKSIRVWRFDPKAEGKHPAVLLLPGADGGVGVEKLYCGLAKRMADQGYKVFIVHYLDATKPEDGGKVSEVVKSWVRGEATPAQTERVRKYYGVWTDCVSDAVGYVRKQRGVDGDRVGIVGVSLGGFVGLSCAAQKELNIGAVVSGFGGLPKEQRDALKWLPPALIVHGKKDDVVPVAEAEALETVGNKRKLPITVQIYPDVGHVFQVGKDKFDFFAMNKAVALMMEHLRKHLKTEAAQAKRK